MMGLEVRTVTALGSNALKYRVWLCSGGTYKFTEKFAKKCVSAKLMNTNYYYWMKIHSCKLKNHMMY